MAAASAAAPANHTNANHPLTKNAKRRQKKKQQQQQQQSTSDEASRSTSISRDEGEGNNHAADRASPSTSQLQASSSGSGSGSIAGHPPRSQPSLLNDGDTLDLDPNSETYQAFRNVFSRFQPTAGDGSSQGVDAGPDKGQVIYSDDEVASDQDASDSDAESKPKLSRRKQRKLQRLTVAELKQLVRKPEVVEWTDVTANDPRLLVQLKSLRNTVPVPPHWGQKRDYLQNKRGIEKPAYQLPHYIADTGIATMKDALKEKEAQQTLKQKTRERVQPKMGKMDIDYQKLHDAFFKFQTKPPLSVYGETYYEGKENETKFQDHKPGELSEQLKEALSIPPLAPPPWLIAMQRFGPPPSYPHLKIPGLNAPIPEGAQWGFHPGGWGRPPVDEYGRPLYGDVLGNQDAEENPYADPIQREPWGELEPEETDDEEEDEEDDEEEDEDEDEEEEEEEGAAQRQGAERQAGTETPSGIASITSTAHGVETPHHLELRKDSRVDASGPAAGAGAPKALYYELPERASAITGFMGSERTYDVLPVLGGEERGMKRKHNDDVHLSIDPEELEGLSEAEKQEKLERWRVQNQSEGVGAGRKGWGSDVADVREELTRQRKEKERRRERSKDQF
ncbi:hypothetical protein ACQY0O_004771 [Thecaphora frezii]